MGRTTLLIAASAVALFAAASVKAQPIGLLPAASTAAGAQLPCAPIGSTTGSSGCSPVQIVTAGGAVINTATIAAGSGLSGGGLVSSSPTISISPISSNSLLGNTTGGAAAPVSTGIPSCSGTSQALNYTSGTGFGCVTSITPPFSPLLGGTGSTFSNVSVGSGLNLTSGSLSLAAPTTSVLGGIEAISPVSHQYITGISTAGAPSLAAINSSDVTNAGGMIAANNLSDVSNISLALVNLKAIAHAASNTVLSSLSTVNYGTIIRDGHTSVGDAPAISYTKSAAACALNSGAGDGGSQIPSADGNCWIANFPSGPYDVREWGAKADGSTDNFTAVSEDLAYASANGGGIYFGTGIYKINSQLVWPDNVSAYGSGRPNQFSPSGTSGTTLDFSGLPANTDGIFSSSQLQTVVFRDMQVVNATGSCFNIDAVYFSMENVTIGYCGKYGLDMPLSSFLYTLNNVLVTNNGLDGINLGNAETVTGCCTTANFTNVYSIANAGNGIVIDWYVNTNFIGSAADQNGQYGFVAKNAQVNFMGTDAESNQLSGYEFLASDVTFIGSRGAINNQSATSGQANVILSNNSKVGIFNASDVNASTPSPSVVAISGSTVNVYNNGFSATASVDGTSQLNAISPDTVVISASIGGSALISGACASTTNSVVGVVTTSGVSVTPQTYPGDEFFWKSYVSSAGIVTTKVCAATAGTPTATPYVIRVTY